MGEVRVQGLEAAIKKITEEVSKITSEVSVQVADAVTRATPIDTGWSQANWVISATSPYSVVRNDGALRTAPSEVTAARAYQEAQRVSIETYTLNKGDIFITNNVNYIRILNRGSSAQAPAAFVESSVAQALAGFK